MVTINNARKILQRVDTLPLYLHAYAFHLNMRLERVLPADLLDIASENNLRGVKIHVLDGGNDSNLLIVFYVQIMPDDLVMQLHRF
ncbi:putative sugar isomerase [Escherichia coli]|uniref:Putative sugar isomerase n=1 Tax=Escherichia coli TaxID=562 RepID=A0A376NZG2_ECOLX|nr:putative sugar isomerase [Escherichia coli]STH71034.1 putative sugar isomerase [Escherichia coli]